ncbi:MAG: CD1247 N-terminal domain-containing protein [Bacillota bacterium]
MSYLSERISYIRGLAEGMNIESETKEGRFLMALVSVTEEMVEAIDEIEDNNEELLDYIQVLEEKVSFLDDDLEEYDEDDDEYADLCERFLAVECPECGEIVYFDHSMAGSGNELICPECNTPLPDIDDEEEASVD